MAVHFCPNCRARANFKSLFSKGLRSGQFELWICDNCEDGVFAMGEHIVYPTLRTEAVADIPEEVRADFNEALASLNAGNAKAAVIMTRSALQSAAREQGANGKALFDEIDDLAERHILPPSMQKWAHELRDSGNLVAHPEPGEGVDIQDAEEIVSLAESIFDYLYVIPVEVERRRARLGEKA